nr:immunoglobulin heavy chain junction region [Homo sapiens]
ARCPGKAWSGWGS